MTSATPESDLSGLREALAAARAAHRQPDLLDAYRALGEAYLEAGRLDEAESALRTSVQQARIVGNEFALGLGLLGLARTLARTERTDRALLAYTEAAASLRGHPDEAAAAASEMRALGTVPGGAR